jgi:hypothetical protein
LFGPAGQQVHQSLEAEAAAAGNLPSNKRGIEKGNLAILVETGEEFDGLAARRSREGAPV